MLVQHWLQRRLIIRDDTDHIHAFGDQILDRLHLQRGIGGDRPDHLRVYAELCRPFLNARFHGIEPWDTADLHDHTDILG